MSHREVIILVHGTGAGEKENTGTRWWQRGSNFWNRLSEVLPSHLKLLEDVPLFHWSTDFESKYKLWKGKNHQLYRHVASQELLEYLRQFEEEKMPYHIIAHSHGGSVLWGALRLADFEQNGLAGLTRKNLSGKNDKGPPLCYLRSCITLGTPFIRLKSIKDPLATLVKITIGSVLMQVLIPLILTVIIFFHFGVYGVLAVMVWLVWVSFIESQLIPIKFSAMQARDDVIAGYYADRWLTIWSEDDEAINLLRGALKLPEQRTNLSPSLPFLPPGGSRSWIKLLFLKQHLYPFLVDKFIIPFLDKVVRRRLASAAFGLSSFRRVVEVSPWPCKSISNAKNLSEGEDKFLKTAADKKLAQAAPYVRGKLALFSSGEPIDDIVRSVFDASQGELVHTSYMDNEIVLNAIVSHLIDK